MPFREKAKSLFRTRSKTSDQHSLSKASSNESQTTRWPSNVYKPGEPMPRPKYRAIPKKEHKDKLEAFSFTESWRRRSYQSQYSPMGTRAPSRRNSSRGGTRQNSIFSLGKKSASRTNSMTSADTEDGSVMPRPREGLGIAKPTPLSTEPEQEGDDDVGNVGGAFSPSPGVTQNPLSRQRTMEDAATITALPTASFQTMNTAHDHQPFTEQELSLALKRSHLAVPTH